MRHDRRLAVGLHVVKFVAAIAVLRSELAGAIRVRTTSGQVGKQLADFADVGADKVALLAIAPHKALAARGLPTIAERQLAVVPHSIADAILPHAHPLTGGLVAPPLAAAKHRGIRRGTARG